MVSNKKAYPENGVPPVLMNAAEMNGWRPGWLEGCSWQVSQGKTRVGIFRDLTQAMPFFLRRYASRKIPRCVAYPVQYFLNLTFFYNYGKAYRL